MKENMNLGMIYADIRKSAPHSQNRMEKSCILFHALSAQKKQQHATLVHLTT